MTPWTAALQALLSTEFPRQEYWSGLPLPPSGELPNPEIKPAFLVSLALAGGLFTTVPPGKSPKNTHFLIPRTYEYITLHGKGELQLQI